MMGPIRTIILLVSTLITIAATAQHRTVHLLRSDAPVPPAVQKVFQGIVADMDAGARCSFHDAQVKVLLDNAISASLLLQRLLEGGVGTYELVSDGGKTTRTGSSGTALLLPPEGNGLDAEQVLRYQQAKDAWIQEHPQLYQDMNVQDPVPVQRNP